MCRLPEKGRKEIEERVEEMKERDREERGTGMKALRFLLAITGRKIEIGTTDKGGTDLNGILNPFQMIERTHLLSVNSSHCSTKWANLPPTGMSGRGKTDSGKGWTSIFCGK